MDKLIFNTQLTKEECPTYYRIPAIVTTANGILLSFCEARLWSKEDMEYSNIVVRRSLDDGETWTPIKIVWQNGEVARNPCPIVDLNTNRVYLLMTFNEEKWEEPEILEGDGYCEPFVCHSDDDGLTWSEPVSIATTCMDPSWRWYATGPGAGIQLKSGRLIAPCNHSVSMSCDDDKLYRAHIVYSDDGGRTWQYGSSQPEYTNESTVVELNNGKLMHNMRHQIEYFRAVGISSDGGETWDSYYLEKQIKVPVCQGSILRLNNNVILFSCPKELNRNGQTIYISCDDGVTWRELVELYSGNSGYSSMTAINEKTFGILYERDNYNKIVFRKIELDDNNSVKELEIPLK